MPVIDWSRDTLGWFQSRFRPQFEAMVIKPVEILMLHPDGKMPAFIWLTCAIDWLAGFYFGKPTKGKVKEAYVKFVDEYFPKNKYETTELYESIRNGLVHMYTLNDTKYFLTSGEHPLHLTRQHGQIYLNLEDFLDDFIVAKNRFFDSVENNPELLDKVVDRFKREGFLGISPIHPLD